MADEPLPAGTSGAGQVWKQTAALATVLGTVIGLATGGLTILLLVRPNLAPSTTSKAQITAVALEPRVTLREYSQHPAIRFAIDKAGGASGLLEANSENVDKLGTVVHFAFEVIGLRGTRVATRWTLFNAAAQRRIGESEDRDPLEVDISPEKKDADVGSWEVWVHADTPSGTALFVRIELYDGDSGLRLTFRDTEQFPAP